MIQFSNGGGAFLAGKGIKNDKQKAAVLGSIAGAQHTRYNFWSKEFANRKVFIELILQRKNGTKN